MKRVNVRDPGTLTEAVTFRVGCIGAIGREEMRGAVSAIADALQQMGIRQVAPSVAATAARAA